jgi:alginate O-acetyltransferase complex protein AlgI
LLVLKESGMLFNSYPFIFGFLPVALIGYQIAAHFQRRAVILWLVVASMAFYAYWRPGFLVLLVCSVLCNYVLACLISRRIPNRMPTRLLLWIGIAGNLAVLCYCKYFFPLLNWMARSAHGGAHWNDVALPLGISFFTFTQIAYLVDLQEGSAKQQDLASYSLFVTFFPHLIAGPILHHGEIMPQFQQERDYRLRSNDLAIGLSWFIMGLFKKVMLADQFAIPANAAFRAPFHLAALSSWAGVLAYSLQLYFDFSGYSDMALGLARMFSIDFPLNFSSPYKAASIIDFWQRWHMTLTRYITVYIYNPASLWINRRRMAKGLKISRKALATRAGFVDMVVVPTILTLLLAGIWHGAGLQFAIFGVLHGIYLSINHAWRIFRKVPEPGAQRRGHFGHVVAVLLTFSAVLLGQVFFRANSTGDALAMLAGMLGLHGMGHLAPLKDGITLHGGNAPGEYVATLRDWVELLAGFLIVWSFPNTQQILLKFAPALEVTKADLEARLVPMFWRPSTLWAAALGLAFFMVLIRLQDPSTFLYFQF